jgi:hypothetical protein
VEKISKNKYGGKDMGEVRKERGLYYHDQRPV